MYSPEVQAKIALLRQKAASESLTMEEMREAIILLRGERRSAIASSEASRRAKAKKQVKSADELLDELEGL